MDLYSSYGKWDAPRVGRIRQGLVGLTMWATVLLPFVGLVLAGLWWWWAEPAGPVDIITATAMYLVAGFGITVGYHRLLAHRAFDTQPAVRFFFAVAGSMGAQGPAIKWIGTHRRHHQRSDRDGDPHSPHLHGDGFRGLFRGLWHAHTGWLLCPDMEELPRSVKDLAADPVIRFVDRTYGLWVFLGALIPFAIGWGVKGTIAGGLVTAFWGFVVRIGVMHHVTWSVNSICHVFGYQTYGSHDHSRNNPLIAILSLGEGWHNNHHAFPTSARHGLTGREPDLSYGVIWTLQKLGLAKRVRIPTESEREAKRLRDTPTAAPTAG